MAEIYNPPQIQIKTGEYTGNGGASQTIAGVGYSPKIVVIYPQASNSSFVVKTDQETGDKAHVLRATVLKHEDDHIKSLDSDGFTVGDGTGGEGNLLNSNTQVYTYIAVSF